MSFACSYLFQRARTLIVEKVADGHLLLFLGSYRERVSGGAFP